METEVEMQQPKKKVISIAVIEGEGKTMIVKLGDKVYGSTKAKMVVLDSAFYGLIVSEIVAGVDIVNGSNPETTSCIVKFFESDIEYYIDCRGKTVDFVLEYNKFTEDSFADAVEDESPDRDVKIK